MTNHKTDASSFAKLPTAQEVYDTIMGQIEPELTTEELALLDERYANESPEDKKTRMERYQRAFEAYEVAYSIYERNIRQSADECKKNTRKMQEAQDSVDADFILS